MSKSENQTRRRDFIVWRIVFGLEWGIPEIVDRIGCLSSFRPALPSSSIVDRYRLFLLSPVFLRSGADSLKPLSSFFQRSGGFAVADLARLQRTGPALYSQILCAFLFSFSATRSRIQSSLNRGVALMVASPSRGVALIQRSYLFPRSVALKYALNLCFGFG